MNAEFIPSPEPVRRELLVGCGHRRLKSIRWDDVPADFQNVTTLDIEPACKPDVLHDLAVLPYPFEDNTFDEIHAYEVLEHVGQQGDAKFFFAQFSEFWRIIKPDGYFCASVPMWDNVWAWGDPGHTRIITPKSLAFLEQDFYQHVHLGRDASSDYRGIYKADWRVMDMQEKDFQFFWVMRSVK